MDLKCNFLKTRKLFLNLRKNHLRKKVNNVYEEFIYPNVLKRKVGNKNCGIV